jgi:hypothetical protein
MPNVTIGHDTVVGAGAIVTKSLPSGCLAVGIPAKPIKENCYPKQFSDAELNKMLETFIIHFLNNIFSTEIKLNNNQVYIDKCLTLFDFNNMRIDGPVTELTEKFRNELRRWGCRFRYYNKDGMYAPW